MKSFKVSDFGQPLVEVEAPTPEPTGSEVVLKVRAAGICHTDLHIWEGGYELGHGRGKLSLKDRGIPLPITLGHETVGEVVALGPEARGVNVGDVRLVYSWQGCGVCELCKRDQENLCLTPRFLGIDCDGGYADHIVVRHPKYLIDLKGLAPVVAAPYGCSGVTTYSALKKVGDVLKEEPIVIIGAGGLGLMALTLHKAMGGKGVIMVDIDAKKREAAKKAGAMAVVDGNAPDARQQIIDSAGMPLHVAIDLVCSEQTAAIGFDVIVQGGKLIMVGLFGGGAPWALPLITFKSVTIQGSLDGDLMEMQELIDLVRREKIAPIPITRRPLKEATQALIDLKDGKLIGRTVLTP
ncbi:alcohol dehydrogenase [Sorangium sp. So ce281]|uniref:alcohol dehydrogenase n=1 Tax=Sorangium sp. So ce281 TaxID=3133293 RepID=UPI003F616E9A